MNKWMYVFAGLLPVSLLLLYEKRNGTHTGTGNLKAFLLMLQYSEGTYGANAYRTLYGGKYFDDYSAHPGIAVTAGGITSTAAGAYQILLGTWRGLQQQINLPDFSPASQDKAAIALINRHGALQDVMSGNVAAAIAKCRKEWASLPGAGYGQREQSMTKLLGVYRQAGGKMV